MLRSTSCGELRTGHVGQTVTLAGWVHRRRDHGNLIFIDLRDRYGLVQVVFNPELAPKAHAAAERFRSEWVVKVSGTVERTPGGDGEPRTRHRRDRGLGLFNRGAQRVEDAPIRGRR